MRRLAAILVALLGLSACWQQEVAQLPPPLEPSDEAVAHFCGMLVTSHPGPKGQVFLEDTETPLWFPSVRDTLAYLMLPERDAPLRVAYVNDMAQADDWDTPAPGAWVTAGEAWYVLGSDRRGGMGLPEAVPFGARAAAEAFQARHGGRIARLDAVTAADIFGRPGS
jgi:copper chaperone NosL